MPVELRLWQINKDDSLVDIERSKLNLEERLEKWLEEDISIVSDDLLIIGRQVDGIDLLCLDGNGDVVILELKRDKTPRDIVAQTLDYASWIVNKSYEDIAEIANEYFKNLGKGSIEDEFKNAFDDEIPEKLNERHRILIVASVIDSSTERIVKYLSENYGVGINAITFQYHKNELGQEFLTRAFLIDPSEVEENIQTKTKTKHKPIPSFEELENVANQKGIGEIYDNLVAGMSDFFKPKKTGSGITFTKKMDESVFAMIHLDFKNCDSNTGLYYYVYTERLACWVKINKEDVKKILPSYKPHSTWKDNDKHFKGSEIGEGYFKNMDEVGTFLSEVGKQIKHR